MKLQKIWDELEKYAVKNDLLDNTAFLNIVLYQLINKTSLSDNFKVYLATEQNGAITTVLGDDYHTVKGLYIKKKSENMTDYVRKNNVITPITEQLTISWATKDSQVVQNKQSEFEQLKTNCQKDILISVYEDILKMSSFKDFLETDLTFISKDCQAIYDITLLNVNKTLLEQNPVNSDGHELISYVGMILDNYSKLNGYSLSDTKVLTHALSKYYNGTRMTPAIYTERNGLDTLFYSKEVVFEKNDLIKDLGLGDGLMNTIRKNVEENKVNPNRHKEIFDDIFNNHILPVLKEELEFRLKMLKHSKTLEQRLDNQHVNDFISLMESKYPNYFLDNEINSYQQKILTGKDLLDQGHYDMFSLLNKSKLIDDSMFEDNINYTQQNSMLSTYNRNMHTVAHHTDTEEYVANKKYFIGEVDSVVKSVIMGELKTTVNGLNYLDLQLYLMQAKSDVYADMAYQQMFKYCNDNNLVLFINTSETIDLKNQFLVTYDNFAEAQKNYPNVFVVDSSQENANKIFENCNYDSKTLSKNFDRAIAPLVCKKFDNDKDFIDAFKNEFDKVQKNSLKNK